MLDRITEMSLTLDEEYMQSSSTFGGRVKLMGAPESPWTPHNAETFDAQIVEATGLEMPEIMVFGGDLYGGGSKFTGTRMTDRVIDLTVVPMIGTSPSDVKRKFSTLSGMSSKKPLTLRISHHTKPPTSVGGFALNRETIVWETKVYISRITSSIFSDSSEVNVTLTMGETTFTRSTILRATESVSNGADKTGFAELRREPTPFSTTATKFVMYRPLVLSSGDLKAVSAPSSGDLSATITLSGNVNVGSLTGVFVDDFAGGSIVAYDLSRLNQSAKKIGIRYQYDIGRLYVWTGDTSRPRYDAKCRISGILPMFRPSRNSFRVGVEVDYRIKSNVAVDGPQSQIQPRRYGF